MAAAGACFIHRQSHTPMAWCSLIRKDTTPNAHLYECLLSFPECRLNILEFHYRNLSILFSSCQLHSHYTIRTEWGCFQSISAILKIYCKSYLIFQQVIHQFIGCAMRNLFGHIHHLANDLILITFQSNPSMPMPSLAVCPRFVRRWLQRKLPHKARHNHNPFPMFRSLRRVYSTIYNHTATLFPPINPFLLCLHYYITRRNLSSEWLVWPLYGRTTVFPSSLLEHND